MENMIPFDNYNVANNGHGEIVAQHAIVALEVKQGPEVAVGTWTLRPEGEHGVAIYGRFGKMGVVYPSGTLRAIDKRA